MVWQDAEMSVGRTDSNRYTVNINTPLRTVIWLIVGYNTSRVQQQGTFGTDGATDTKCRTGNACVRGASAHVYLCQTGAVVHACGLWQLGTRREQKAD